MLLLRRMRGEPSGAFDHQIDTERGPIRNTVPVERFGSVISHLGREVFCCSTFDLK
jgi:hypothetical protein